MSMKTYIAQQIRLHYYNDYLFGKGIITEEAQRAAGVNVRLLLRVGEPPKASPEENFKNLLKFSSQFDNIEIK